jgi:hypothetical protein
MSQELRLTPAFYTLAATTRAADAFKHLCRVRMRSVGDEFHVVIEAPDGRTGVVDEFLNYVLALSAQELLG